MLAIAISYLLLSKLQLGNGFLEAGASSLVWEAGASAKGITKLELRS
jgi:hypothetical protein